MVAASHLTSIMFWNKKITMCTFFLLTHCILHDLHIYYEIHEILRYNLGSRNPNTEEYDYRWIKCSILGIPSTMENTRIWQKLLLWWPKRNLHELVSWLETRVWTEKSSSIVLLLLKGIITWGWKSFWTWIGFLRASQTGQILQIWGDLYWKP